MQQVGKGVRTSTDAPVPLTPYIQKEVCVLFPLARRNGTAQLDQAWLPRPPGLAPVESCRFARDSAPLIVLQAQKLPGNTPENPLQRACGPQYLCSFRTTSLPDPLRRAAVCRAPKNQRLRPIDSPVGVLLVRKAFRLPPISRPCLEYGPLDPRGEACFCQPSPLQLLKSQPPYKNAQRSLQIVKRTVRRTTPDLLRGMASISASDWRFHLLSVLDCRSILRTT